MIYKLYYLLETNIFHIINGFYPIKDTYKEKVANRNHIIFIICCVIDHTELQYSSNNLMNNNNKNKTKYEIKTHITTICIWISIQHFSYYYFNSKMSRLWAGCCVYIEKNEWSLFYVGIKSLSLCGVKLNIVNFWHCVQFVCQTCELKGRHIVGVYYDSFGVIRSDLRF